MELKHVSKRAKNLLKQMLTVNVDRRITAFDARNHEWFVKCCKKKKPFDKNTMTRISNDINQTKSKWILEKSIKTTTTQKELLFTERARL